MDIIVDLDGTVANCDWRLHHIREKPKNWKAFFDGISKDDGIKPLCEILSGVYFNSILPNRGRIIFCTGRPDNYQQSSLDWIRSHIGIDEATLYMRPRNDHRPDYEVKRDLLKQMKEDGFNPTLVIDDKPEVCEMFMNEGLIVLQMKRKSNVLSP